jgi:hypothetical protein
LRIILPSADLSDPDLELKLRHHMSSFSPSPMRSTPQEEDRNSTNEPSQDDGIESMVRATGQLDLDEQGNLEYHGHSSGLSFMRRMRESLGDAIMGPEGKGTPFLRARPMSQAFDSPRSQSYNNDSGSSPWETTSNMVGHDLPPLETARKLCDMAVNNAAVLMKCVHWPSFQKQLERLYELGPENYGNEENKFLPLVYSLLAIGTLFQKGDGNSLNEGYESAIADGCVSNLYY